jgi:hypothetical protein
MRKLATVAALVAAAISPNSSAYAQSTSNYDEAARHADRAIQSYKDLQHEKMLERGREAMAGAMIGLYICKPMHDQTALSRRQYIASVVKGRARQKAVARECAGRELWYQSTCQPRTGLDAQYNDITVTEPSCPTNWTDWPPPPPVFSTEYYQRIADIERLYQ